MMNNVFEIIWIKQGAQFVAMVTPIIGDEVFS